MDATSARTPLNVISRVILATTAAVGMAVVILAVPTHVAALGRAPVQTAAALKTLSAAPGLILTRVYGAEDEDCVAVSTADGSSRSAVVCAH